MHGFDLRQKEISELHVGLKGTMNALFLKDLAAKTHRGIRGRVEDGKSGDGFCYGYKVVKQLDARGDPIRGHVKRGTGLMNNELYIGRLIWNRLRYLKDPSTGKRVSRLNPESEWIVKDVPDLRIIDDELWRAVRERQGEIAETFANVTEAVRAHHKKNRLNGARRSLLAARRRPLRLLKPYQQRFLLQQPRQCARRFGAACACRIEGPDDGGGDRRRRHARPCGRDEPAEPETPLERRFWKAELEKIEKQIAQIVEAIADACIIHR